MRVPGERPCGIPHPLCAGGPRDIYTGTLGRSGLASAGTSTRGPDGHVNTSRPRAAHAYAHAHAHARAHIGPTCTPCRRQHLLRPARVHACLRAPASLPCSTRPAPPSSCPSCLSTSCPSTRCCLCRPSPRRRAVALAHGWWARRARATALCVAWRRACVGRNEGSNCLSPDPASAPASEATSEL